LESSVAFGGTGLDQGMLEKYPGRSGIAGLFHRLLFGALEWLDMAMVVTVSDLVV